MHIKTFTGSSLLPHLTALAQLRITVFRDWPYLYEGSLDYEHAYLENFAACPQSFAAIAFDAETPVGASTCLPLAQAGATIHAPVTAAGHNIQTICYFGESVLLAPYRGQGLGVQFFAAREAHAQALHATHALFYAVRRERPSTLEPFWRRRGFAPQPISCQMDWPEPDPNAPHTHTLDAWMKPLCA